ncbi:hypothetical protein HF086_000095 [Spodoptera exigua]|uniref:Uncharacterized protein n=1 Tax=Spodoptera exigua TaxID=7107 RepID=A0A922SNA6_SPOEX|nr:hypothetical protein HF086_000095 [Spodoptera exigua]
MQETHDGSSIPHLITQKHSADSTKTNSTPSPNNETKIFTITPTENLSRVLDVPTISEVKIDILDQNQCGDRERKSPEISSYILVDNILANEQPDTIFNETEQSKRFIDSNKFPRKKSKENKHIVKFKINFKNRNPKKNIRRLKKYCGEAKTKSRAKIIKKQIYSNSLSKVVSRWCVLKKVLAKENRIDECDDACDCDSSSNYSPPTTKRSFTSYTSQNTLVRLSSSSSRTDDINSIKTVKSVIQVSSDIMPCETDISPYKTNIIDLAVAVTFSGSKPNNNSGETLIHQENLTSEETFLQDDIRLTSKAPSQQNDTEVNKLSPVNMNNMSDRTLIGDRKSVLLASSDDTFVIAKTSSDFNKSSINSDYTLTSNSDIMICNNTLQTNLLSQDELGRRKAILDNLGFYPVITPSTSSGTNIEENDVLVTEKFVKSYLSPKNKGDEVKTNLQTNMLMLKKPYENEKISCLQKNISLPNDIAIKAKIKESEKTQRRSYADEFRNKFPADINEMWERLTFVLDLTIKRLEETLAERIVNDIRRLSNFNQSESKSPKINKQIDSSTLTQVICERPIPDMVHKEVFVAQDTLKEDTDGYVQCDLVQNQVIDQLMYKLSVEEPKPKPVSNASIKKLRKTEIVKDYFEILKPPASASVAMEEGRGDIGTVATATATEEIHASERIHRLQVMLTAPKTFVRENMFIITSVPSFFIVLLCFYGLVVIIMNAW